MMLQNSGLITGRIIKIIGSHSIILDRARVTKQMRTLTPFTSLMMRH